MEGVDLISSLPDVILQHILLFIPTKLAIRTSVLSKIWKRIWCEIPSLSFDDSRLMADTINKTLILYTAKKITNFHLSTSSIVTAAQLDSWIEFLMPRNIEKLSLEFVIMRGPSRYSFPDLFYRSSSVKQLTLNLWRGVMVPTCTVSWTSLKSLSLLFGHLSDELVAKILSGCPVLESLTLSFFSELGVLDLSELLRLRRLEMHCNDTERKSNVIVAPHIHYLRLRNPETPDAHFVLSDVSSLTEADLDICSLQSSISMANFEKMLEMLQNVKKLTLGANFLQVLSLAELHGVLFRTINLEALTLEITLFNSVLIGITKMLQTSPGLRKIDVHIKKDKGIPASSHRLFNYLKSKGLNQDQSWKLEDEIYQTPSHNFWTLMTMEEDAKFVFWLVKFLLGNAKTVETMVVLLENDISEIVLNKLLQMVPTLSGNNKVSIVFKRVNNSGST